MYNNTIVEGIIANQKVISWPYINSIHWSGVIGKKIREGSFSKIFKFCPYKVKDCKVTFGNEDRVVKIIEKDYHDLEINIACKLYPDFYNPHVIEDGNYHYVNMRLAKSDLFDQMFNKSWQRNVNFLHRTDIMLKLARDLKRLHDSEYAHLDIKPENILIATDNIYWADFGLARKIGEHASHGTCAYMAPEMFANDKATAARDVFALAVTTWGAFCKHENITDSTNSNTEPNTIFEKRNKMVGDLFKLEMDGAKVKIHAPICYTSEQRDDIIESTNPDAREMLMELLQKASNPDPDERCNLDDFILGLEKIKDLELSQMYTNTIAFQERTPLLPKNNTAQKYISNCRQKLFTSLPRRTTINNIGIGLCFLLKTIDGICNSSQKYNSQHFDTRTIPHIVTSTAIIFYIIGVKVYNGCCCKQKSCNKRIKLKQTQNLVSIGCNGAQVVCEILNAVTMNSPIYYRLIFNVGAMAANTLDNLAFGIVDTINNCAFAREDHQGGCVSLFFSMVSKLFSTAGDIAIIAGFNAASVLFSKKDILTQCILPGLVALWFLSKIALTCPANTIDDCVTVHNDSRFEDVTNDVKTNEQELDSADEQLLQCK